ncbi:F510_1955 family glycosylhydrolase [Alkalihalobacillus deserti]|uniref:F510_1955 family glycosylhydrolase n=1 Tax=Alkalihalobacillus deserti TaxID=2879466 RepID=UPI001D1412E7|nr:glycosyl hydrolase [Alkalihalobacillus deserti]
MRQLQYSLGTLLTLLSIPFTALAHGTEKEHQQELLMNTMLKNGLIASIILLVGLIAVWYFVNKKMNTLYVKKKEENSKRNKLNKLSKIVLIISVIPLLAAIILGFILKNQNADDSVTFMHIHGLDYTSDGQEIYVPAHDGLKIYADGVWSDHTEGEPHDYMGFSMVEDGFYSSGHPAPGSKMADPFGIVKSTDKGKTLEVLDLYEEIDFHGMTVGYNTKDIYVFNPSPNSRMDQPGFYFSTDETKTWNQSKLEGLVGKASTLATHPTEEGIVAIGTDAGVFISQDYGDSFEPLLENVNVTAVSFDHNNSLLVAVPGKGLSISLDGTNQTDLNIPQLDNGDAIAYVRQNPKDVNEFVFATFNKDIFLTKDSGETWTKIVDQGIAK